jgi:hypothetical protein
MMVTIGFFLIGVEEMLYQQWLSNMAAMQLYTHSTYKLTINLTEICLVMMSLKIRSGCYIDYDVLD